MLLGGEAELLEEVAASLDRLSGCLVVIELSPASRGKLKGRPDELEQVVDGLIDSFTRGQLESEEELLSSIFDSIAVERLVWVADDAGLPRAVARQHWLVLISADQWDLAVEILADWPDEEWPVGWPRVSLLVQSGGTLLPFGARLAPSLPVGFVPLERDEVARLAEQLSYDVLFGDTCKAVSSILSEAVDLSHELARQRLRQSVRPTGHIQVGDGAERLRQRINSLEPDQLRALLHQLIQDVEAEATAPVGSASLSGELLGADVAADELALASPAYSALGAAMIAAVERDLEDLE